MDQILPLIRQKYGDNCPPAPWCPPGSDSSDRKIKSSKQTSILADQKKISFTIHSVQHTSNKTKVPNQSSAILKRPQKSETIFLYFDWLKFASLVNHNTELPGAPERDTNGLHNGRLCQIYFCGLLRISDWYNSFIRSNLNTFLL